MRALIELATAEPRLVQIMLTATRSRLLRCGL
jgi:hypothetical protein